MIVEHSESFQAWLSKVLKPLCDADPGALAKYVLALIKKDKTEKELRQSMIDQLDVFLQSETKPFVDKLFEALNTKEYLNAKGGDKDAASSSKSSNPSAPDVPVKPEKSFIASLTPVVELDPILMGSSSGPAGASLPSQPGSVELATSGVEPLLSKKGSQTLSVTPSALLHSTDPAGKEASSSSCAGSSVDAPPASLAPPPSSSSAGKEQEPQTNSAGTKIAPASSSTSSSRPARDRRDLDEREKNRRKRSRVERERRNSRSRSAERNSGGGPVSKRSRSPRMDRDRDRDRDSRPLRHRLGGRKLSPPPRRYERDNWDRRRSRSPPGRNRSCSPRNRCNSPPPSRSSYRRAFNGSRSRSRSPLPVGRGGAGGGGGGGSDRLGPGGAGDRGDRERDRSRSPRSRSRSPHPKDGGGSASAKLDGGGKKDGLLPNPAGDGDAVAEKVGPIVQSVVVRPGDNNPGAPGVGISQSGSNRCRDFDEKGLCMRGELCPFDHGKDPVVLEDIVVPGGAGPGGYGQGARIPGAGAPPGYNPPMGVRPAMIGEYYPDNPQLEPQLGWGPGAPPPFRPRHPLGFGDPGLRGRGGMLLRPGGLAGPYPVPGGGQRQLISVPVVGGGNIGGGGGVPPGVMGGPPGHPGLPPMLPHPGLRGAPGGHMRGGHRGGGGRGGFDHGRLGAKHHAHHAHHHLGGGHGHRNYSNCSLEVRKIPREQNTIMDLNSHFLRFGKIINIQINYDSDPEAALVTFSSPAEAQLAYRSTEAVLNNRFIRVFWHNKEKENEEEAEHQLHHQHPMGVPPPGLAGPRIPVKERLGAHAHPDPQGEAGPQEKILLSGNNLTKTVYNQAALKAAKESKDADRLQAVDNIKRSQEMLAAQVTLKNLAEAKKAEASKLTHDLRKRQQTMMEEQIDQQKRIIARLESGELSQKEREEALRVLKVLQESVQRLRKDLEESSGREREREREQHRQIQAAGPRDNKLQMHQLRTKEEAQKEMLDAELDLINKEQQGGDTIDLQKKVLELRARAKSLGLIGVPMGGAERGMPRGRPFPRGIGRGFGGRGRGMIRGRGRGSVRALRSVDRRPTKIRVTGFPASKLSDILSHFSVFGPIRDYSSDANVPMMIVDFDSRKCAEVAMANGAAFEDTKLGLEWVATEPQPGNVGPGKGDAAGSVQPGAGVPAGAGQLLENNGVPGANGEELDTSEVIDEDEIDFSDELGAILGTNENENEISLTGEGDEDEDFEEENDRSWRR